ncbi:hypothetical protein IQ231_02760 [Cuspidothrix issatschenkoi LEGE 03284]|uniref:hypothetical protein n=1 Tax=Cuspidothrix issatschenkoi TaxID=230752 RepID=UPI0018826924|nr:hypothetical protein [Cuspidothrix issatschenkoi]MBE9230640.1 hypothetical protein [Cuspidothrix issatschenkoi LEGE 03284]
MIFTKFATYTALSLTYLGLALGYIPGLPFNHATIAFASFAIWIAVVVVNL